MKNRAAVEAPGGCCKCSNIVLPLLPLLETAGGVSAAFLRNRGRRLPEVGPAVVDPVGPVCEYVRGCA